MSSGGRGYLDNVPTFDTESKSVKSKIPHVWCGGGGGTWPMFLFLMLSLNLLNPKFWMSLWGRYLTHVSTFDDESKYAKMQNSLYLRGDYMIHVPTFDIVF